MRHIAAVRGRGLERFATWAALAEEHGPSIQDWPSELQDPESSAVALFAASNAAKIDFHCWLQWLMEEQLAGTQQAAVRAGMALGVMHDLPVGVVPAAQMPGACRTVTQETSQ